MSEAPQVPRLLAALLGIEPPPPSGPPRSAAPPEGAGPRPAGGVPVSTGAGEARRPPAPTGAKPEARTPGRPDGGTAAAAPTTRAVRTSVRQTLASRDALRTGVVVAEVLGRPRAMRPYGADGA